MEFLRKMFTTTEQSKPTETYNAEVLHKHFQDKVTKGLVNFINANPKETEARGSKSIDAIVKVEELKEEPKLIFIDIECNNFIKFKAEAGEVCPTNFMPEVMEFPVLSQEGEILAHSYIQPIFFPIQPSIMRFCGFTSPFTANATFDEAFSQLVAAKLRIGPLKDSCLVSDGDFDEMFIIGELLRNNRAEKLVKELQYYHPTREDLKGDTWTVIGDLLRFINFKDEFARFYPNNPDRKRNDTTYMLELLNMKYEDGERHHSGIDDTKKLREMYIKLRETVGQEKSRPLFVKTIIAEKKD